MPFLVTRYETTPNPNALKCWLDTPISEGPRSFLSAEMAADDDVATALFARAGVVCVLFNGDWLTVNKPPEAGWPKVKRCVEAVLAEAGG